MIRSIADLNTQIDGIREGLPVRRAVRLIEELSAMDRFQGSRGLSEAAGVAAEELERLGIPVTITEYPADGAPKWWTFRAPPSWSPTTASLHVTFPTGAPQEVVAYPRDRCCLATYSCATISDVDTVVLGGAADPIECAERIAVLPRSRGANDLLVGRAFEAGTVGVVTDVHAGEFAGKEFRGRFELSFDSRGWGFSLTQDEMDRLLTALDAGGRCAAHVAVDATPQTVPVVLGTIGECPRQPYGLVSAHLCHPGPGVNDNASGVAAALMVAAAANRTPADHGLMVVLGPEMLAPAALFRSLLDADERLPAWAVALDMVGEDVAKCGGRLVVERWTGRPPSPVSAVTELCISALSARGTSYGGARDVEEWAWASVPFVGASDHGLTADNAFHVPSTMVGHWPDRFRHSSADDLEKLDVAELCRVASAIGSSVELLRLARLPRWVQGWAASAAMIDVASVARRIASRASLDDDPDACDPLLGSEAVGYLSYVGARSKAFIADVCRAHGSAVRVSSRQIDDLVAATASVQGGRRLAATRDNEHTLHRVSDAGPFNLFAILEHASRDDRDWLREKLSRQRGGAFARFRSLAQAIGEGTRTSEATRVASYQTEAPVTWNDADRFFGILESVGWATRSG